MSLNYPIFTGVDPDPYSKCGSGSTKFLNMEPIWIRIHHTGYTYPKRITISLTYRMLYVEWVHGSRTGVEEGGGEAAPPAGTWRRWGRGRAAPPGLWSTFSSPCPSSTRHIVHSDPCPDCRKCVVFFRVAGAGQSRGFWLEPEPKFSPGSSSGSYSYSTSLQ